MEGGDVDPRGPASTSVVLLDITPFAARVDAAVRASGTIGGNATSGALVE